MVATVLLVVAVIVAALLLAAAVVIVIAQARASRDTLPAAPPFDGGGPPPAPGGSSLGEAALKGLAMLRAGRRGCGGLGMLLFAFGFAACGLFVAGIGLRQASEGRASQNWPTASGVVTRSEVVTSDSDGTTMYEPAVDYTYTVGGREYIANRVSVSSVRSSASRGAYRTVEAYPVGSRVTVYYDPAEPYTAVLEPGVSGGVWLPLGIGAAFTLFGGIFGVVMLIGLLRAG